MGTNDEQWISVSAAAALVGVSVQAVRDAARRYEWQTRRYGKRGDLRVRQEDVEAWKRERAAGNAESST